MRLRKRVIIGLFGLFMSSGCAAIPPAQVGQTAGTIAGSAILPGVGAPIGALVGLLAGMLVQGEMDKVTARHERKELGEELAKRSSSSFEPIAPPPGEPVRVWVDETMRNGRLIAGHFDTRRLP